MNFNLQNNKNFRWVRYAAVYLFYLGIAVVITWPLVTNLSTRLTGFAYGDGHEMARHIWWYNYALRTGEPIFYQPMLGYPNGMEGVLLWAHPQQFFPAWLFAFLMPLPAAANLSVLLMMAFNGWAMYLLALDRLEGLRGPALLAGLAFMAAPTFQGHLGGGHAGLMVMWPVPLYILALFRLREMDTLQLPGARRRWIALAVLFFVLSPGGHILQLIYVLLPITGVFALWQLIERNWKGFGRTVLISAVGCAILLIFILPIARSTLDTPAYTDEGGFTRYSADLLSIVSPSFFHPLYAQLEYPRRVLGINLEEGVSYIGLIAGILGIIAVWKKPAARWWLVLALVTWVLSLGPLLKVFDHPVRITLDGYESLITLPWAALQNLPFFSLARTPGRFNFPLALAVAMLAGYGAAVVWRAVETVQVSRRSWIAIILLMGAILFDYQFYWPLPTIPAAIPDAVRALSQRSDVRAVFDIPWGNPVASKDALYLQTVHQLPLIAGHVTRSTPVNPARLTLLQNTLDPALLNEAGADIVILHKAYITPEMNVFTREQLGEPFFEDVDIALFEVPETEKPLEFQAVIASQSLIENHTDTYIYAPDAGWVDISGTLEGETREVKLYLDRDLIHRWVVDGEQAFRVPVPVSENSYHIVTLTVQPPCPQQHNLLLECQPLTVSEFVIENVSSRLNESTSNIQFDKGVTLVEAGLPVTVSNHVVVRLLWHFDTPRAQNEIRFIHMIDSQGKSIAQADNPIGELPAGQWAEEVTIPLADDLPSETYRVYVGWYTLPDVTRFAVHSDVEGAQDGWALLGNFELEQ